MNETPSGLQSGPHAGEKVMHSVAALDSWFQSMRQDGGFGGPVAHWWQSRYTFTGPGLDWRYEGILIGYRNLFHRTGDNLWRRRLNEAAGDLIRGQNPDGTYKASQFENNPGVLGTPHEAAASYGLLEAADELDNREAAVATAIRNLDGLISTLWDADAGGFNDRPGIPLRVPNKLATLARSLAAAFRMTGREEYLRCAQSALEDVIRMQVADGPFAGAVHQGGRPGGTGDGRFFPYYNARCVPALVEGASLFGEDRYLRSAEAVLRFLDRTRALDGTWPQIQYASGRAANWPRWRAGIGDLLLAYKGVGRPIPERSLDWLLSSQLASGGFATGHGFSSQVTQVVPEGAPDLHDATPVVGWNDKAFRLLVDLLPAGTQLPRAVVQSTEFAVTVRGKAATFREDIHAMTVQDHTKQQIYCWTKTEPWARGSLGATIR